MNSYRKHADTKPPTGGPTRYAFTLQSDLHGRVSFPVFWEIHLKTVLFSLNSTFPSRSKGPTLAAHHAKDGRASGVRFTRLNGRRCTRRNEFSTCTCVRTAAYRVYGCVPRAWGWARRLVCLRCDVGFPCSAYVGATPCPPEPAGPTPSRVRAYWEATAAAVEGGSHPNSDMFENCRFCASSGVYIHVPYCMCIWVVMRCNRYRSTYLVNAYKCKQLALSSAVLKLSNAPYI